MALMDLLSSLINPPASQGPGLAFGQTAGAIAPGQATGPGAQESTPLSELVVRNQRAPRAAPVQMAPQQTTSDQLLPPMGTVAPPIPGAAQTAQPPAIDYNNSGSAQAVNQALQGEHPQGGMANPGLYGVLPQGLQHGTLRNVLGALGDALLVSGGRQPQYEDRMQRQEVGQAMAGLDLNDPQSVAAASQRIAATGAAGSPEMADKVLTQAEQAALRKQYMEYNQTYRQQVLGDRESYHAQETQARRDTLFQRMYPAAIADLSQAKDADDYAQRLSMWNQRIKAVDPDSDAIAAFGVPLNFTPGLLTSTSGMSNSQIGQQANVRRGQDLGVQNTNTRAAATLGAARVHAGGQIQAAGISANRPSDAQQRAALEPLIANGTATPAQQQMWAHLTQVGRGGGRTLPPGLTPGGAHAPPPAAVAMLQHNPGLRSAFDAKYGAGASTRVLGH